MKNRSKNPRLTQLRAVNFRSLGEMDVPLGDLTVLVGPNGSGKTNVLNVLRFLASTVQFDLAAAVKQWGGFERVRRRDGGSGQVKIQVSGQLTKHASYNALDEYELSFGVTSKGNLNRKETFTFKCTQGRGRRITVAGTKIEIGPGHGMADAESDQRTLMVKSGTTGLSTLPRLSDDEGGEGIRSLAAFLESVRVLEPNVNAAREPSRMVPGRLADDAGNLASALYNLHRTDGESFNSLVSELHYCLPGLCDVEFVPVGGAGSAVAVVLRELGVASPIELADASFGTVRLLALLTALHEPDRPPLMAIEEVDHGLHPYALDILVDRLRAASKQTQLLITTHSPCSSIVLTPTSWWSAGVMPKQVLLSFLCVTASS